MNKTQMYKQKFFNLKYFWNCQRIIFRGISRSYIIPSSIIISLIFIYAISLIIFPIIVENSTKFPIFNQSSNIYEGRDYTIMERAWLTERSFFSTFGFAGIFYTIALVVPILLLINKSLLNPLRSGIYLVYLSTPVKKSTNIIAIISQAIFIIFIIIVINEVGKYGIAAQVIKDKYNEIGGYQSAEIGQYIYDKLINNIPYSIGYNLMFSLVVLLLIIIVGINTSSLATNSYVFFFFVVTSTLYIGVQVALANIPSIEKDANWVPKMIAFLFIGCYPSFFGLHSYINAGYLNYSWTFYESPISVRQPYLTPFSKKSLPYGENQIEPYLHIRENELLIIMTTLIIILIIAIFLVWRRKRIL